MYDFEEPHMRRRPQRCFDEVFPLRIKNRQSIDSPTIENIDYSYLEPNIELIARASYRLGHAEREAQATSFELSNKLDSLHEANKRIEELKERLGTRTHQVDEWKGYYRESQARVETLEKRVNRLTPKKKPVVKKKK